MATKPTILITGVSRRLGLAFANHFLDKSWHVIGTYRTQRDEVDALKEKGATLYGCDFQNIEEVHALITTIQTRHAALRAIIHNASDWIPESSSLPPNDIFEQMMTVHAKVPYLINLGLRDALTAEQTSSNQLSDIIHVTDYVAQKGSKKHLAYSASKAALENLTLSFAAAFAPNVKVNAIAPALLKFNEGDDAAYKEKALKKAALPWEGSFEEAIEAVEYLLRSRYVTGQTISLNGGRHLK